MFIKAIGNIQHNNKLYTKDEVFECSKSEANRLIYLKVAILNDKKIDKWVESNKTKNIKI